MLAGLTKATGLEVEAAQQADRRASALEAAREASEAESRRWKRREMLVRQQIDGLTARADQLESAASLLDAERDVLAKERDALKAALTKAGQRSGYSVLPYKGPNGTWRRPIVLECTSGGVKLQPKGLTFTAMDLSPLINPRSSPLIRAIAHEMLQIRASDTPDGAAAVPYLVFLVRPGGIRLYYEARTCLEPLGIAFGYELIEQDLVVDIPDLNNLATWDGSVPLDLPLEPAPRPKVNVAMNSPSEPGNGTSTGARGDRPASNGWPESPGPGGQQSAGDPGNGGTDDAGRLRLADPRAAECGERRPQLAAERFGRKRRTRRRRWWTHAPGTGAVRMGPPRATVRMGHPAVNARVRGVSFSVAWHREGEAPSEPGKPFVRTGIRVPATLGLSFSIGTRFGFTGGGSSCVAAVGTGSSRRQAAVWVESVAGRVEFRGEWNRSSPTTGSAGGTSLSTSGNSPGLLGSGTEALRTAA